MTLSAEERRENLRRANEQKQLHAIAAVERAIVKLANGGDPVSFASVARAAGVSRTFLYQNDGLAEQIRAVRGTSHSQAVRRGAVGIASDESLRRRLTDALDELSRIKAERDEWKRKHAAVVEALVEVQRGAALPGNIVDLRSSSKHHN